ncbi:MAG: hypothetical protein R3304_03825 [Longimicrobiales bacterium]|nr:hypothetical protein [Longimicrobiales bacterium]
MTPDSSRWRRSRLVLSVLGGVVVLSGCRGSNLFSLAGTVGEGSDAVVEITRPTSGFQAEVGDSILVEANVEAPAGAGSVTFIGTYEVEGTAAYVQEQTPGDGRITFSLSNHLQAVPGQVPGTAFIVVRVTEQTGATAADTVTVNITAAITS